MLKKAHLKLVAYMFTWLGCLSGLVILMNFIQVKKKEAPCKEVKLLIPGASFFISREEVNRVFQEHGGPFQGRALYQINTHSLAAALKANPFIENAKIFQDMDGKLIVLIQQREPMLRVFNQVNEDFYVDKNGLKIPSSKAYTASLLVANGSITERFQGKVDTIETTVMKDLFKVATYIKKDSLWDAQIEQLYMDAQDGIEMVPRVGEHIIILGDADSLTSKFRNLLAFYKIALPKIGWNAYETINVKYRGQIVCKPSTLDSVQNEVVNSSISKKFL